MIAQTVRRVGSICLLDGPSNTPFVDRKVRECTGRSNNPPSGAPPDRRLDDADARNPDRDDEDAEPTRTVEASAGPKRSEIWDHTAPPSERARRPDWTPTCRTSPRRSMQPDAPVLYGRDREHESGASRAASTPAHRTQQRAATINTGGFNNPEMNDPSVFLPLSVQRLQLSRGALISRAPSAPVAVRPQ